MDEEMITHTAIVNFDGFLQKMDKNRQLIQEKTGRISYEYVRCHVNKDENIYLISFYEESGDFSL